MVYSDVTKGRGEDLTVKKEQPEMKRGKSFWAKTNQNPFGPRSERNDEMHQGFESQASSSERRKGEKGGREKSDGKELVTTLKREKSFLLGRRA